MTLPVLCPPAQLVQGIDDPAKSGVSISLESKPVRGKMGLLTTACSNRSDASKVPPSQFQKRKGSLYSTPGSRDGHVDSSKKRDKSFHDKLKEKVGV